MDCLAEYTYEKKNIDLMALILCFVFSQSSSVKILAYGPCRLSNDCHHFRRV